MIDSIFGLHTLYTYSAGSCNLLLAFLSPRYLRKTPNNTFGDIAVLFIVSVALSFTPVLNSIYALLLLIAFVCAIS